MLEIVLLVIAVGVGDIQAWSFQAAPRYGAPIVEKEPLLLNSFLPASMQIIAHLTDLMKYEIKPASGSPTSTTVRPTPAHKPGVYSPMDPPGAVGYYSKATSYQEYIDRLKAPQGFGYFDRYTYPVEGKAKSLQPSFNSQLANDDLDLLGAGLRDLLKQVNKIDDYDFVDDDDDKVLRFSDNYDDSNVRSYVIGNKKIPPTRAYVTLLSLYDLLNKESKKLQLNKYGGYTSNVLEVLTESSTGSSAQQLHTILSKIVERKDVRDQQVVNKIKPLIGDLEQSGSYINDALRYIPALQFAG